MSNLTERETHMFELGRKTGRKEMLEEIYKALGLDEYIAARIATHEEQHHDQEA